MPGAIDELPEPTKMFGRGYTSVQMREHAAAKVAEALARQRQGEPVAWVNPNDLKRIDEVAEIGVAGRLRHDLTVPLYATPAAAQPAQGDSLEAQIIARRIAITPEYEGGFHAAIYGDEAEPQSWGFGNTPSEAIEASQPTHP